MLFLALLTVVADFDLRAFERARVVEAAEVSLAHEPRAITSARNPRSAGGPHDFSSEGDYWWPDPQKPDGPYLRRDGLTNPDNFVAHRNLMFGMARDVGALGAAWDLTRDERFAAAAVRHLRAWFVDPATRMSPHLLYAQAIKGVSTGRGIGIIDTVHLAEVALAIEALRGSKALTPGDDAALIQWFRDYLQWMRTHAYGIDESKQENNHGTCWVLQAAAFARLTGDAVVLAECRERFRRDLLTQMAADGSFPRELARTKPYGYAIFNLDVMTATAVVLSTPDDDLMRATLPDGRGMLRAVAWLAPFLADKSTWPKAPDVMYWNDWPIRQPALLFGALASDNPEWLAVWRRLPADSAVEEVQRNFPVRFPTLWLRRAPRAAAALPVAAEKPCVFCQIVAGTAPAAEVLREGDVMVFLSHAPRNAGHALIIPTAHAANFLEVPPATLAHMTELAQRVARAIRAAGLPAEGIQLLMNTGAAAGQSVFHAHLHVIPHFAGEPPEAGKRPIVPPEELAAVAAKVRAELERR